MTTSGAIKVLEMVNPIIKRSTNYVRRLEIDEEDKASSSSTCGGPSSTGTITR